MVMMLMCRLHCLINYQIEIIKKNLLNNKYFVHLSQLTTLFHSIHTITCYTMITYLLSTY